MTPSTPAQRAAEKIRAGLISPHNTIKLAGIIEAEFLAERKECVRVMERAAGIFESVSSAIAVHGEARLCLQQLRELIGKMEG